MAEEMLSYSRPFVQPSQMIISTSGQPEHRCAYRAPTGASEPEAPRYKASTLSTLLDFLPQRLPVAVVRKETR